MRTMVECVWCGFVFQINLRWKNVGNSHKNNELCRAHKFNCIQNAQTQMERTQKYFPAQIMHSKFNFLWPTPRQFQFFFSSDAPAHCERFQVLQHMCWLYLLSDVKKRKKTKKQKWDYLFVALRCRVAFITGIAFIMPSRSFGDY